jgi:hypothetical protein
MKGEEDDWDHVPREFPPTAAARLICETYHDDDQWRDRMSRAAQSTERLPLI